MSSRVLVVDDHPGNRRLLARILSRAGLAVLTAGDGREALDQVRREHPDLVLLDIVLPGLDGYEVCRAIKGDPAIADTPVIFLSSLGDTRDKVKGLDLGGVDYVTKPFDSAEVLARAQTQLRIGRLTADLRHVNEQLGERQRRIDQDLRAAAEIQRALIPRPGLRLPGVRLAWLFEPCATVGGDVFNALLLDGGTLAVYMIDVSGHGVPAAMLTVAASHALSPQAGLVVRRDEETGEATPTPPGRVLAGLDSEFRFERFERYFTICYLLLEIASGRLRYSRAAHPAPILQRDDGTLELLGEGGSVIGIGGEPFEASEVELRAGYRLFLHTDGIPELEGARGRLGTERFHDELKRARRGSLTDACAAVQALIRDFSRGREQRDDIALLAVEYTGAGS